MLENRPIVAITIGYIIGIILGLYCKISIALLYLFCFIIYSLFKKPHSKKFNLVSLKRYFRYVKLIITKKVFIIIILVSIISNTFTLYKNYEFQKTIANLSGKEIKTEGIIISNVKNKKYSDIYTIKIKDKKFYLNIKKTENIDLEYGDRINLTGNFIEPETQRNYRGFDYRKYLKTQGIYGNINVNNITKIQNIGLSPKISILKRINSISNKIKNIFKENFNEKISNVILGMLLGYTDEIDLNVKEDFSKSNISHILAVSGMHVGYVILFCNIIFSKLFGKRKTYFITIIVLIFYMFLTGLSPSVVRASIMACFMLFSKLIYRKSDVWTNISISLLSMLIYNPFCIGNISLILSYVGTIGILTYSINFKQTNKIKDMIGITLSVTIFLIPILSIYFNKIPIFSLFVSLLVGIIVLPIFILAIVFIVLNKTTLFIKFFVKNILNFLVKILLKISEFGSKIPLNQIYVVMPNWLEIFIYYVIIFISVFLVYVFKPKRKQNTVFNRRIKNLFHLLKFRYRQNKEKVLSIFLIVLIFFGCIKIIPKELRIHFIDVGQGDSCLIVTPNNKKILIDGGGSENYDIGKNTLIPYLMARRIKKIDYIIISHFDTDHVGGMLTVMEEIKVEKVVISRQGEDSENYQKFKDIVKEKKIKNVVADKGDKLKIEKNIYFDILWPNPSKFVSENVLNNNSIVCKLQYKNFSMLFTGDIEKEAEKPILHEYKKNLHILNSTILKVAHHGSKTSTTEEFLKAVSPKFALIGVGKDNKFGHPNDEVIKRLENDGCKIYRTDKMGEISISVNYKGKIKVKKFIK